MPEPTEARKTVRRLKRALTGEDRVTKTREYKRKFKLYKTYLLRTRVEKWKQYCAENSASPWGTVFKVLRDRRPTTESIICKENGELTRTIEETLHGARCPPIDRKGEPRRSAADVAGPTPSPGEDLGGPAGTLEAATTGRFTAAFIPKVRRRRKALVVDYETTQAITGHGAFRKYPRKIGRQ